MDRLDRPAFARMYVVSPASSFRVAEPSAAAQSIHKHALVSPYKTAARPRAQSIIAAPEPEPLRSSRSSKARRGSKHIGPCLPDGPSDHVRVPQEAYQEPVTELGYQKIDHHRIQPIMFKNRQSSAPGIRLRDVDGESSPGLEGADDRVFDGVFPYREIKIRVLVCRRSAS